jgi:hypothetical protein
MFAGLENIGTAQNGHHQALLEDRQTTDSPNGPEANLEALPELELART